MRFLQEWNDSNLAPVLTIFSDSRMMLQPTNGTVYKNPVAILTNRGCYSATTTMIYLMNPIPQVTIIGDRTGGGSGSVAEGYLAKRLDLGDVHERIYRPRRSPPR